MKNELKEFIDHILAVKNSDDLGDFLQGILTPKELEEIPLRLQIIKLLKSGMPQREIAQRLGVGIATVSRGSREIQLGKFKDVK